MQLKSRGLSTKETSVCIHTHTHARMCALLHSEPQHLLEASSEKQPLSWDTGYQGAQGSTTL